MLTSLQHLDYQLDKTVALESTSYASNHGRACRTCPYRFQFIITLIAVVIISSFGVAGVGGNICINFSIIYIKLVHLQVYLFLSNL